MFDWQNFLHAHQKSLLLPDLSRLPDNGTESRILLSERFGKRIAGFVFFTFFRLRPKKRPSYWCSGSVSGPGWGNVWSKNNLDLKAFGKHSTGGKSAVFWQIGRNKASVSPCTETDYFTGFSGYGYDKRSPNWAYFSYSWDLMIVGWSLEQIPAPYLYCHTKGSRFLSTIPRYRFPAASRATVM